MSGFQSYFENLFQDEVSVDQLCDPAARAMAKLVTSGKYGGASLVSCRGMPKGISDGCLLFLDLVVELGQRPQVHDVLPIERVAVVFSEFNRVPAVFPTREGFPFDVPHINLSLDGYPRPLCLFEMPLDEAERIATPFVLIEWARTWMKETAYGRLHGDNQPLDPAIQASGRTVIIPSMEYDASGPVVFQGFRASEERDCPAILLPAGSSMPTTFKQENAIAALFIATKPVSHGRIRSLPENLADLVRVYEEIGIPLLDTMRISFRGWRQHPFILNLLKKTCVIVVRTPIERSPSVIGGIMLRAFIGDFQVQDLFEWTGALYVAGGVVGEPIAPIPPDMEKLALAKLDAWDVCSAFTRRVARASSGLPEEANPLSILLVGAGALGSQIAMGAARMGIGKWTIVDGDHLMPHNVARHALLTQYVGAAKSKALAAEIGHMLGPNSAEGLFGWIKDTHKTGAALQSAQLVIDASASVPTSRWLATKSHHDARTVSTFLNPKGTDLVVLKEGSGRQPRLDHLEMAYYWMLANTKSMADHLANEVVGMFPSGGCRTPSLRIPESNVMMLSAIGIKSILENPSEDAAIEVWRSSNEGISVTRPSPIAFREVSIGEWCVAVSEDLLANAWSARRAAGNFETGGILVGSWDRSGKKVYIVGAYDPPPDSVSTYTSFARGEEGVYETLEAVQERTVANLTYVGEWHTHPPGYQSRPSSDDALLLRWIGDALMFSDVPALMLIAGQDGIRVILGSTNVSALLIVE